MGILIHYVANYASWIYAACGLIALYQIYRIWSVRSERRQAIFSLEREKAVHDTYNIFAIALILLLSMGLTYFISTTLATAVQPLVNEAMAPTPPLPFVSTPTNTPIPATSTPTETAPPPTRRVEAVDEPTEIAVTEEPTLPVVMAPACPDARSVFLRPGRNEQVSGILNVIGTASHEGLDYYKVEYAPGSNPSGGWVYIAGGNSPVVNNVLASFDTRALGNGDWTLRLIVVDKTGNYPVPCQVTIRIQN